MLDDAYEATGCRSRDLTSTTSCVTAIPWPLGDGDNSIHSHITSTAAIETTARHIDVRKQKKGYPSTNARRRLRGHRVSIPGLDVDNIMCYRYTMAPW